MKCNQVSVNINRVKKFYNADICSRVATCFNFLCKQMNNKNLNLQYWNLICKTKGFSYSGCQSKQNIFESNGHLFEKVNNSIK